MGDCNILLSPIYSSSQPKINRNMQINDIIDQMCLTGSKEYSIQKLQIHILLSRPGTVSKLDYILHYKASLNNT